MPSFDLVSKVDLQTLDNAINTVEKEIKNRFDFKGNHVVVTLNKKDFTVSLEADSEMKLQQIIDVLISKSLKQGLAAEIYDPATFERRNIEDGTRLILWGLFKKIVIADNLYESVSQVYGNIHHYTGFALITILIIQTVYIYCDFSGYTNIALGIAKCFGINLINNFNRPFLAKNISEFWRRWHMSLSSWCNDYIYNPFIVKYRRFGNNAVIFGIFLTFFIVGIWHGANLTFVILGLLQGIAIVYEFYTKRYRLKFASKFSKSTVNTLSRIFVFIFMSFSMVFFFSNSVADAWYFIMHLFNNIQISDLDFISNKPEFIFTLCLFIIIFIFEILDEKGKKLLSIFLNQHFVIRWAGYLTCMLLIYFMYSGFHMFYYARF